MLHFINAIIRKNLCFRRALTYPIFPSYHVFPFRRAVRDSNRRILSTWKTSYSGMSNAEAEARLGLQLRFLEEVPIRKIAPAKSWGGRAKAKELVFEGVLRFLRISGSPENDPEVKEIGIHHLAYAVLSPIIDLYVTHASGQRIEPQYEKVIPSKDGETGGQQEFVLVDVIGINEEEYVFVVEAKRTSMSLALKQCLLSMREAQLHNGGGKVFGFITTGGHWRMIEYDGKKFRQSEEINIMFANMRREKSRWIKSSGKLVDMVFMALSTGGNRRHIRQTK